MKRTLAASLAGVLLALPAVALAFPFGGQIYLFRDCPFNGTKHMEVGGPRGGEFIWVAGSTRTYQFGPPSRAGQWVLGLAGVPYYCIFSIFPLTVFSGVAVTMMGSSGPSAPAYRPSTNNSSNGLSGGIGGISLGAGGVPIEGGAAGGVTSIGHIVVSEVYYRPDSAHGGASLYSWIELYNGSPSVVDLSNWTVRTASSTQTIQSGTTLGAGQHLLIIGTTTALTSWTIPANTQILVAPNLFSTGLSITGDVVTLQNAPNVIVDAVSWGTNTTAFSPAAPVVTQGHSIIRRTLAADTDSASDWVDTAVPNPGQ